MDVILILSFVAAWNILEWMMRKLMRMWMNIFFVEGQVEFFEIAEKLENFLSSFFSILWTFRETFKRFMQNLMQY